VNNVCIKSYFGAPTSTHAPTHTRMCMHQLATGDSEPLKCTGIITVNRHIKLTNDDSELLADKVAQKSKLVSSQVN